MNVRRPTLSRQIRQLEDDLGLSLFDRNRDGVKLTPAGRNFLARAHRVLFELDQAIATARQTGRAESGPLALGIMISLTSGPLRTFLSANRERFSDIEFSLLEESPIDLVTALREHRIDLAIGLSVLGSDDIETMFLWLEPVFVAVPANHPLAARSSVRWNDLQGNTFMVRGWNSTPTIHDYLVNHLPIDTKFVRHLASREAIFGLVGAGYGITAVSESAIGPSYPGVVFRRVDEPNATIKVTAAWLSDNTNPVRQKFLAMLRDYAKGLGITPPPS
jgi:DNA-binding transcriptional LysR family regulator